MKDAIIIEPYNEQWPALYEALRQRLVAEIANSIVRIDHIGSTAVAGLAAKSIIDIQEKREAGPSNFICYFEIICGLIRRLA